MTTMTLPRAVRPSAEIPVTDRRRRLRRADALVVLAWISAAVAAALYLGSDAVDLTSSAGVVTGLGIVAGLVGSDLVLVMLVLAARLPLIDRAVGHDRAMAAHKRLGKPAFLLLVAHGLLLTIGYGLADQRSIVSETLSLFASEDMPLAYLSLGLFAAVIVTSLVVVRRRLPYEAWHVVHLLSYAAVLVGLPHQLSQGAVLSQGVQRVYWIALYVVALGAIVAFRIVRPAVLSIRHGVRVESVEAAGPDAVTMHLSGRRLDRLGASGGQFFAWRFLTGRTWWHAHPLSLSASPSATSARITFRLAGPGTRRLADVPPGTRVAFSGPFGIFTARERSHRRVLMLAAGIGVTPIRAMLDDLEAAPGHATVLVRGSSWDEVFLWPELAGWAAANEQNLFASIGPRGGGPAAWLSRADVDRGITAASILPEPRDTDVYLCGPDGWADAAERAVRDAGVPASAIHRERFGS